MDEDDETYMLLCSFDDVDLTNIFRIKIENFCINLKSSMLL